MAEETDIVEKLRAAGAELSPQQFALYLEVNIKDLSDKPFSVEDLTFIASEDFWRAPNPDKTTVFFTQVDNSVAPTMGAIIISEILGDGAYSTVGLYQHIQRKIDDKEKLTDLEIKAYLHIALSTDFNDDPNMANLKRKSLNDFLTYVVENQEDSLNNLVSLGQFKFENYDRKITEQVNKHLSTPSLAVKHLEKARLSDLIVLGSSRKVWYWGTASNVIARAKGLTIQNDRIALVDTSLLNDNVEDYAKPFYTLGYGDFEDVGTNDVRLKEGSRFSNFKLSSVDPLHPDGKSFWQDSGGEVSVELAYNSFLVGLLMTIKLVSYDKYEIDLAGIEERYTESIDEYLNSELTFYTGFALASDGPHTLSLKDYIAKKILDTFRYTAWLTYVKEINKLSDEEAAAANFADFNKAAFAAGEAGAEKSDFAEPTEGDDDALSDEDIEARQKFLKQCMLMTRLDEIAAENLQNIAKQVKSGGGTIHLKNKPYGNRFYMVQDDPNGDQSAMINKLIIPAGDSIREFLDIKPSTHAYLIPKLRFYKVYTDKGGKLQEFRFHFRNFTDPSRVDKLSDPGVFDRGGDYGVKSFDFSFQGATPATAKNDIKASLSLYFQTFNDFIDRKKFKSPDGEDHAFVDLLLLPSGKPKDGAGAPSVFQFNPKYYRIRVDVGWEIESTKIKDLQEAIGVRAAANLSQSLEKINKSFYLNMIDHTMDFRDDGSVQIDVEYRAYIESALKGTSLDALASRESRKALKIVREDYIKVLSKNRCTTEELNEIRLQLEQIEDLFKKQAYQSIMKRLIDNDTIYFKKAKDNSAQGFIKRGILTTKINFENMNGSSSPGELPEASRPGDFTSSESGFKDLKLKDDYLYINYFYLGDLLYAISDALYEDSGKYIEGFERFKFVLGSFQYEDLLDNSGGPKTINLANIPISCELFYEWFTQNIIKPERNSYPIMYFIRDLCKFLIIEILSETCFKRSFNKSLQFKTMNFLGKAKNKKDPLSQLYPSFSKLDTELIPDQLVLNLATRYGQTDSPLPLAVDDEAGVSISDLYNYVTIYVETPRLKSEKDTATTRQQDEAMGVMHYQIGRDRGILKKIKFTKSDMQYIREARFFRHGTDGLMQLSAVYKVSMEMIGNTLYYPGMEIFIDPLGLFGVDEQADPRQKNSIANRLGFGGYHLITNVRSSIGPGKFTTTVDALFSYSGDGDPSSILLGSKDAVKKSETNPIDTAPDDRPQSSKDYCEKVYNKVITQAVLINDGQDHYKSIDDSTLEADFDSSVAAEAVAEAVEIDREERAEEALDMTADEILEDIPEDPSRPFPEDFEEDE